MDESPSDQNGPVSNTAERDIYPIHSITRSHIRILAKADSHPLGLPESALPGGTGATLDDLLPETESPDGKP
jgi:hypothetical protein